VGTIEVSVAEETPDLHGAYPRLTEAQLAALAEGGTRRSTRAGDVLYRAGDTTYDFYVILEGKVATVADFGVPDTTPTVVAVHGPGRFVGEITMLCGQAVFLTAVVVGPGSVLAVPVDVLCDIVSNDPVLGDLILRALLTRRSLQIGLGTGFRIIGSRYSDDARRLREFAARNRVPHRWIDLEEDQQAETLLRRFGISPGETPVVIWRDELVLRNPTNAELARVIGLRPTSTPPGMCDVIVVGAGPAGLAAAVYGASEGLTTVVLEAVATGGQAGTSSRIENYLGFPAGISGAELADRAVLQARKFGAAITVPSDGTALLAQDGHQVVRCASGEELAGHVVLIATGCQYRRLDVPRMDEFERTSVYYAATEIEANLCRNDPVAVVGGGNSAGQAAIFLAQHAGRVSLIVREPELTVNMSRYLAERIEHESNIDLYLNSEVRELGGDNRLETVVMEDTRTGDRLEVTARALFVFIGTAPRVQWLRQEVALDDKGFVLTGPAARSDGRAAEDPAPLLLETSRPGVFAAGDVRSGSVKRIAAAVGEGALAVRLIHQHLAFVNGR
jgi:thioredoxin reductase (NADPH)